ncbi:MAG: heavy metal translocating P-type ATPase metal-binding domain-containing protein, partial [Planctomycetota bacterium]
MTCSHCGLDVPAGLVEEGASEQFCCGGCRIVHQTLRATGLGDDYYQLRSQFEERSSLEPARATGRSYDAFDREAFQSRYVRTRSGADGEPGLAEVDLLLEGVRCAACVWLVERLPRLLDGVVEVRLRMRDARVTVIYDPERATLSAIARELDALGYPAHPPGSDESQALARRAERGHLVRMGIAGVCAGNAMLVAFALYSGREGGLEESHAALFRWVGLALGWIAILGPGRTFLRGAWAALRTGTGHLDLPIAIALVAGGLAGTWNTVTGRGEAYFDSLTVLVFLLLVGRYVQARQQRWASDAVELTRALTPASCRVVRDGERTEEVTLEELSAGDLVEVRPGEPFPADGTIESGATRVDRALLSGEAEPVAVAEGDAVHAGCQNVAQPVRVRVAEVGSSSRVGRLMGLVEEGLAHKPPIERLTDRIAGVFVVVVCGLGLACFLLWLLRADLATAIDHTVALLIVACPCALGLATPLTLAVAVGRAARSGLLVKDAAVFERIVRGGRLVLDKTGTLTHGAPRVVEWRG